MTRRSDRLLWWALCVLMFGILILIWHQQERLDRLEGLWAYCLRGEGAR